MMSGRLKKALSSVPATNPSCTDKVSQLAASPLRFHSLVSAGTTAEPLNQRDMPSNSAIASSASIRQRSLEPSLDEEVGFRKREIVAQRPPSRRLLTRKISVLTTLPLQSAAG